MTRRGFLGALALAPAFVAVGKRLALENRRLGEKSARGFIDSMKRGYHDRTVFTFYELDPAAKRVMLKWNN